MSHSQKVDALVTQSRMPAPSTRVISLFCGCGGLDLGFAHEGYEIVFANDFDPDAVEVYRRNPSLLPIASEALHLGDIWQLLDSRFEFPEAEVVKGGFPCQGFSLAGKRNLDDSRNLLYRAMKEVVRRVQPQVVVAENVRGLQNIAKGQVLQRIIGEFEELGYELHEPYLVDAADYGVPQHRERLFIVGTRRKSTRLDLSPMHWSATRRNGKSASQLDLLGAGLKPFATVRQAIGDLERVPLGAFPDHTTGVKYPEWYEEVIPFIREGQRLYNFRHDKRTVVHTWELPGDHFGKHANSEERRLLETLSRNRRLSRFYVEGFIDGSPMSAEDLARLLGWPITKTRGVVRRLVEKGHLRERVSKKYDFCHGTYNQYQRLAWDEPARTLVTNVGNPRNMLHPTQPRAPSVRECARLMSFPDSFVFGDDIPTESKYRMLGNAVPPLLAEVIARALKPYFIPASEEVQVAS